MTTYSPDTQAFIDKLAARSTEAFAAIWLDKEGKAFACDVLQEGIGAKVETDLEKVVLTASFRGASKAILLHNHPTLEGHPWTGLQRPSDQDTYMAAWAIRRLGKRIEDILVVGANKRVYSFKDEGFDFDSMRRGPRRLIGKGELNE